MQEFNASVRFDGPSRVRIRRSGTPPPTIRGRRTLSDEPPSGEEDPNGEGEEDWRDEDSQDGRSSNTSAPSSDIGDRDKSEVDVVEYEDPDEEDEDDLDFDEDGQPIIKISGPVPVVAQAKSALIQVRSLLSLFLFLTETRAGRICRGHTQYGKIRTAFPKSQYPVKITLSFASW